jgi:uncharacterized protein YjdB
VFGSRKILNEILQGVNQILRLLALRKIDFIQVGGYMPTNFSIQPGQTGSFSAVKTPSNGGSTTPGWSSSDASITLTPSADGLTCEAAVPTGYAAQSFDLTIAAVSTDSSIGLLKATHTITVNPPPPPALTALDFVQTA